MNISQLRKEREKTTGRQASNANCSWQPWLSCATLFTVSITICRVAACEARRLAIDDHS